MSENSNTGEVVIKPHSRFRLIDIQEIWNYRELFYALSLRDLRVRYKQTVLGALWALFQPVFQTFVFTIFFGRLAKIPSGELPYPLFVLIGLVFWNFFSRALSNSSNSLVNNVGLVKKVYFPRLILPFSSVTTSLADFGISLLLLIVVLIGYQIVPSFSIVWTLPFGLLVTILAAAGGGFFLSAINVRYRDIRYILPFFIQIMIFLTPVIYPAQIIGISNRPIFKFLLALNPMTGAITAVRSSVEGSQISFETLAISFISAIAIFVIGLYYFRKTEKHFADIV